MADTVRTGCHVREEAALAEYTTLCLGGAGRWAAQGPVELMLAPGAAGDLVVASCVGDGLAGLQCLSGTPGRAAPTPIQNVGAYGQEVAERITSVRVYDRARRAVTDLAGA